MSDRAAALLGQLATIQSIKRELVQGGFVDDYALRLLAIGERSGCCWLSLAFPIAGLKSVSLAATRPRRHFQPSARFRQCGWTTDGC